MSYSNPRAYQARKELLSKMEAESDSESDEITVDERLLQQRIERANRDTDKHLEHAARDLHRTLQTSAATEEQLAHQGEQITHMKKTMGAMDEHLNAADELVKSIGSWFYGWLPGKKRKKSQMSSSTASDVKQRPINPDRVQVPSTSQSSTHGMTEKQEKLLNDIHQGTAILKERALNMNQMLTAQNKDLDDLNQDVDKNRAHLVKTNKSIQKQLLT